MVVSKVGNKTNDTERSKPVIIIEAGQYAGTEPVRLVLVFIQQLTACMENTDMITKVKWVLLPSVNPDGMVYDRHVSKFAFHNPLIQ